MSTAAAVEPRLSAAEVRDLRRLEGVIRRGGKIFHKVGRALAEINQRELYRVRYASFADYCRDRWGFGRSHSYRLIDAAEVLEDLADLSPMGDTPQSERQARPLAQLDAPASRRAAWDAATAGPGAPTQADVQDVVARMLASDDPAEQQEIAAREGERIRTQGRRVEERRGRDERTRRLRKMLAAARLVRKDGRGLGAEGRKPVRWAEHVIRWCGERLGPQEGA
jgi:hypothetical protein